MRAHIIQLAHAARKGSALRRFFTTTDLHRQRQNLRALDDHILRDIGLTRAIDRAKASPPFRDAPESWPQVRRSLWRSVTQCQIICIS